MKNYGYFRVAAAVPEVRVADTRYNTEEICRLTSEAFDKNVSLVAFPELSLTGYTCGDLFHQDFLISKAEEGIRLKSIMNSKQHPSVFQTTRLVIILRTFSHLLLHSGIIIIFLEA